MTLVRVSFLSRMALLALPLAAFFVRPAPADSAPPLVRLTSPAFTQAIVTVTARDTGDRMRPGDAVRLEADPQPVEGESIILLDPARRFQTIVGFGGAFTDAAAETFYKLPPARQNEVLTAYFSSDKGLGYTLGRTTINSCDFSSDTYSYDDFPSDTALAHFSVAHDLKYKIPLIKAALAMTNNHLSLFASPWSPPAWMKTNNDMAHGGQVRPEYRQAWADYYARFIQAYRREGVPIWGLTVQNEPMSVQRWESCIYTGQDEHDFVRDYLGPTLRKAGLSGVHLMIWDHNRGILYQRAQAVLEDPVAAQYVWGTAFHWYVGDHFENVQAVHEAFPEKALLFTEGSMGLASNPMDEWAGGERYGKNILLDLSHWSVGWTDWNLLLDSGGGPNHSGNFCAAPILADIQTGALRYLPSYYYLGQFSKFIRPGAQRIACTSTDDRLQAIAFLNPDKTLAVVVLNLTDEARDYKLWIGGKAVTTNSPAHSIETVLLRA